MMKMTWMDSFSHEQIFEYEEGLEDSAELLVHKNLIDDTLSFSIQKTTKYDEDLNSVEFEDINLRMNKYGVKVLRNVLSAWLLEQEEE